MAAAEAAAAATGNPWVTLGSSFLKGFGESMAAQPTNATGTQYGVFDASGWNVAFGAGDIDSNRAQEDPYLFAPSSTYGAGSLPNIGQYVPYVLVFAGVLIVWRLTKR